MTTAQRVRIDVNGEANKRASNSALPVVSLFCGPGGFDVGFEQAGFTPVLAIDAAAAACKTFKYNHSTATVLKRDLATAPQGYVVERLRELPDNPIPVGVIGGPPCQAFSLSNGYKTESDPRAELPRHYAAALKELNKEYRIDYFVFENVLGLKHLRHHAVFEQFKRLFASAGFTIFEDELDAVDFGVAQVRKRVFIVGFNKDKYPNLQFSFPSGWKHRATYFGYGYGGVGYPRHFGPGYRPRYVAGGRASGSVGHAATSATENPVLRQRMVLGLFVRCLYVHPRRGHQEERVSRRLQEWRA
jgi:hypothetical protein